VPFDRLGRNAHRPGDLLVRQRLREQVQHFRLARAQKVVRFRIAGTCLRFCRGRLCRGGAGVRIAQAIRVELQHGVLRRVLAHADDQIGHGRIGVEQRPHEAETMPETHRR